MPNSAQMNWDELRYVLAVADKGSVAAAGRALGVNHSTVLRRIAAFETRHGLRIFEKTPHGYRISSDRSAMIEALREAGEAIGHVEHLIVTERPQTSTGIRLTSTDAFCHGFLPRVVSGMAEKLSSPIIMLSGNAHLDFSRLQADVTVRPATRLPEELAGSKAASFRFGVYCAEGGRDDWLGMEGAIGRSLAADWLNKTTDASQTGYSSDSFIVLAGLAAEGLGRALLPVFLGDTWPGLRRMRILDEVPATPIWVASHVDLLQSGRLKRVRALLTEALAREEKLLMGV